MANAFAPFDYGQSVGQGTKNALGVLKFKALANQLQDQAQAKQDQQAISNLAPGALNGNQDALDKLTQINPQVGMQIKGFLQNSNAQQVDQFIKKQNILGYIAQVSPDEQTWNANYARAAQNGVTEAGKLVGHFSPEARQHTMMLAGLSKQAAETWSQPQEGTGPTKGMVIQKSSKGKISVLDKTNSRSDIIVSLSKKISNGTASPEEQKRYYLLINADPLNQLISKMNLGQTTPASSATPNQDSGGFSLFHPSTWFNGESTPQTAPQAPSAITDIQGGITPINENPAYQNARDAIKQGADPAKVKERLKSMGLDPSQL